ncbi:ATP-binding protein [Psychromonas sp. SA13A]|uniref:ATP-binding protein n=1 Tax=Psychromonas sp. SA13A TaxID=2686346 RepID=UPI001409641B|nr:ATP-binding protein [Psychromonas sp. SA13A]
MNDTLNESTFENATPNPEFLIKSISEQGYKLSTALADLIDNSISSGASHVDVIIDTDKEPFSVYIADNGDGMNETTLSNAMKFPSQSIDVERNKSDMGRFGLGMKTASFSQTRNFTVISTDDYNLPFKARTWDLEVLKQGKWQIKINDNEEINSYISQYNKLAQDFNEPVLGFQAKTLIIWKGLYKFEDYLSEKNRKNLLVKEISEDVIQHLSIIFHRFMQRKIDPLRIRVNNSRLIPFDPFPNQETDFRSIKFKQKPFGNDDIIKLEGFVLPVRAIDESKSHSLWTPRNKGLIEMEGIYVYRANRLIYFGDWNNIIRRTTKLQLARLKVDIGNNADHLLHLNVAKSQVIIPHELKVAFSKYIVELKREAEREFHNRGLRIFSSSKQKNNTDLFSKLATNKGAKIEFNTTFPLLKSIIEELPKGLNSQFKILLAMVQRYLNVNKFTIDKNFNATAHEYDDEFWENLRDSIYQLKDLGLDNAYIEAHIIKKLGISLTNLPESIQKELK